MAQANHTNWRTERINNFVKTQQDLADRIDLAVDPEFAFGSDVDAKTLRSLEGEMNDLKTRAERPDMHFPRETLEAIRNQFVVMTEQLRSRRMELDGEDFPDAISPSTPRRAAGESAGPSRSGAEQPGGNTILKTLGGRPSASGPQRTIPSTQIQTALVAEGPFAKRERLGPPPNPQTFDVVFFPSRAQSSVELPHDNISLRDAQTRLKAFGLFFQVHLPRQGHLVQEHFDDQIRAFCEKEHINLPPGEADAEDPPWTLMLPKGKTGKWVLKAEVLAPLDFTVETLTGKKFGAVPNYVVDLSKDPKRQLLLIAPIYGDLDGAITLKLPNSTPSRQMKHFCHVSRLKAAIQHTLGECQRRCAASSDAEAATSSSSYGPGRTLA